MTACRAFRASCGNAVHDEIRFLSQMRTARRFPGPSSRVAPRSIDSSARYVFLFWTEGSRGVRLHIDHHAARATLCTRADHRYGFSKLLQMMRSEDDRLFPSKCDSIEFPYLSRTSSGVLGDRLKDLEIRQSTSAQDPRLRRSQRIRWGGGVPHYM